ncbi:MAG TPA: hypothetical protein VKV02_11140 [Acidobacteriaceae bacterium]|nr:hypothetical protein [Acidobacteriaceae bacterium]
MDHVKIHQPQPATQLPAHEQTARKRRSTTEHLPAIPGHRPRRAPKMQVPPGRKTTHVDMPNCPSSVFHRQNRDRKFDAIPWVKPCSPS